MSVRDSILAKIYDFKHCQNVTEVAIAPQMDLLLGAQVVRRSGILGGWLAHSCTRFPCYLGMEINAETQ